jgi:ABC-type antimicrobial peptide transport system permease subunit
MKKPAIPLTDSTLLAIQQIPGVDIAFPEIRFPVKVQIDSHETRTTVQALPVLMGNKKPFNKLMFGNFFGDDTSKSIVIDWNTLRKMNVFIQDPEHLTKLSLEDSLRGMRTVHPDSIIGKSIKIISATLDGSQLAFNPMQFLMGSSRSLFSESVTELKICGIHKKTSAFSDNQFRGGIIAPIKAAQNIPRLGFSSVWELLGSTGKEDTYSSLYVRVKRIQDMKPAREAIEKMGLHVFSISDQLEEFKRGFLIMDSLLGAVGTVALFVAALGIINTMVMSILERTREIGIMKAIGGSENEIRMIFFVEAATVGLIGAFFGLILGWIVTRIANVIANSQFLPKGEPPVDFFYFPLWLILGAVAFSIVVSLVAGLYPANRAARVDPVKALRHD